jgi:alpha-ribazole phosphatase
MRTRIVLVRHAEPDETVRGRCYGRIDCGLSPHGVAQAERLGSHLSAHGIGAVYTSPLRRALATATPIADGLGLDPVVVDDLGEIHCGEFEGLTWAEIEEREPGFFFWSAVPAGFRFPGGESYAELADRSSRALAGIRARHPGETVAVVTHAGVLRTLLARMLAMPETEMFRLEVSQGGVSVVDWVDESPIVRLLNGDRLPGHLAP